MNDKNNAITIAESCIKAVAANFPVLSGAASLYGDWKNNIEYKNIYNLIESHAKKLEELENNIDSDYLQSDDYAFTLHKTILKAKNEIRENKRKLFADFITKSCLDRNSESKDKLIYLEIIDKLELEHLNLLQHIYKLSDEYRLGWTIHYDLISISGIKRDRTFFLVSYLIATGLVIDFDDFKINDKGELTSDTKYLISELGSGLIEFLKEN